MGGLNMFSKLLIVAILTAGATGFVQAQSKTDFIAKEGIGNLRIGSPESDVKKNVECPLKTGEMWRSATLLPEGKRGLFGPSTYHQELENIPCGIKVGLAAKPGSAFTVESIAVFAPNTMATSRGIRVGSTEQEVEKAYAAEWNRDVDERGKAFVAGAIDKGIIFYFENGRVFRILLRSPR